MKIIHVDTDKFVLNQIRQDIAQIAPQAQLHCFKGAEPALAFAEAQGCDVLLTEVEFRTEKFGGIHLAKAMQELNPKLNIIFVTAFDEYEVSRELSALRVGGYITKPWETEKLAEVFRKLNS